MDIIWRILVDHDRTKIDRTRRKVDRVRVKVDCAPVKVDRVTRNSIKLFFAVRYVFGYPEQVVIAEKQEGPCLKRERAQAKRAGKRDNRLRETKTSASKLWNKRNTIKIEVYKGEIQYDK
ncbi:hypothetical protein WMZ97_17695 [Lentibacillus sp. N15]